MMIVHVKAFRPAKGAILWHSGEKEYTALREDLARSIAPIQIFEVECHSRESLTIYSTLIINIPHLRKLSITEHAGSTTFLPDALRALKTLEFLELLLWSTRKDGVSIKESDFADWPHPCLYRLALQTQSEGRWTYFERQEEGNWNLVRRLLKYDGAWGTCI